MALAIIAPCAATGLIAVTAIVFCAGMVFLAEAMRRAHTYTVTDQRAFSEFRFLKTQARQVPLGAITNISPEQDVVGRLLRFGNVLIETPAAGTVMFNGVSDPYKVADGLRRAVRENAPKGRFW